MVVRRHRLRYAGLPLLRLLPETENLLARHSGVRPIQARSAAARLANMYDPEYLWFIEEVSTSRSDDGDRLSSRLNYGPFESPEEADDLLRDLRRQPRYRLSDLVVSKQRRGER